MTPVTSSQVKAIGHDPATNTLTVQFHTGSTYTYDGVDAKTYDAMLNAKSIGKFLGAEIKGKYKYKKVG